MRDTFTHTERDAARWEAQHADRESAYDGEPFDQPLGPTTPSFAALCDRLLIDAGTKHACTRGCGGTFYNQADRDNHEKRCGT